MEVAIDNKLVIDSMVVVLIFKTTAVSRLCKSKADQKMSVLNCSKIPNKD